MTPENDVHEYDCQPGRYVYQQPARQGWGLRLLLPLFAGAVIVVAVCFGAVMLAMSYLNRLDSLEKTLAMRGSDKIMPMPQSDRQQAASAQSMTSNTSQPQIYFMVGGQGGGAGGYGQPPYQIAGAGGYPAPQVYHTNVDIDEYMLQKYGSDYADFLRQRSRQIPAPGYAAPAYATPVPYQGGAVSSTAPFIRDGIRVPTNLTLDLRKRFTADALIEEWFRAQAEQNFGQNGDKPPTPGMPEPNLDDILKSLAATNFADKNYEKAARIYTELASRQVHLTREELMQWAKASELSGDIDSALKIMNLVYQNYPEDYQVLKEMAALLVGNQRFGEAAELYKKLMELEPDDREWRLMRARTLTWSGQGREAVELLRALHIETPMDWDLSVMLAELLLSEHQFEEVLPLLDTMIEYKPEDGKLQRDKIDALEALQRFVEAADMVEILLEAHPEDPDLLLKLAKDRVAAQEFEKSLDPFAKYLTLEPDDLVIREEYADALMAAQSFSEAAVQFGLVSDEKPDDFAIRAKYANALMAADEFDRASYVYSYLVEDKPGDAAIAMGYVVSLRMSGQLQDAYNAAVMHLNLAPTDSKMMIQAAELAFELKDNYDNAIRWFRSAIRLNPQDADWRVALGNALIGGREYEAAENEFRSALTLAPDNFKAKRGLGRALFFQRKYEDAWKVYGEMIRWDPMNEAIAAEYRYYKAISVGMEDEAQKQLLILIEQEPDEITWKGDRVQSLLRQFRFKDAIQAAQVVYEENPDYRSTRVGMMNVNQYLTSYPVQARAGYLRKKSEPTDNPEQDRQANITYRWMGVHGEGSLGYNWRIGADFDREYFGLKTDGVDDVKATRLKMSATYEGSPELWAKGELGYRWLDKGLDDQILYDVRGELRELGGLPLTVGAYSRRREFYDNWQNVYDNLYAVDFGVDATYRWNKWDFSGRVQGTVLSDNNSNFNLMAMGRYRLLETPCFMLEAGPDVEYTDWKYNRPEYFSPQNYWQAGLAIDGRYYLCRDPEVWGGPSSYIDFGLMMYRDRFSSWGQKGFLSFNHDYSDKFSVFARADVSHESYYDEVKLFGGLQYKFGGCEE